MRFSGRIALVFCLAAPLAAPLAAEVVLTMKSGERYEVPQPPKHRNGMVSFTTKDGRFLTVKQSEVAKEETVVPAEPKKKLDRTDTRQLGAIAREERAERGIGAAVADHPAAEAEKAPKPEKPAAPEKKKPRHSTKKKKTPPPPPPPPPAPDSSEPH